MSGPLFAGLPKLHSPPERARLKKVRRVLTLRIEEFIRDRCWHCRERASGSAFEKSGDLERVKLHIDRRNQDLDGFDLFGQVVALLLQQLVRLLVLITQRIF